MEEKSREKEQEKGFESDEESDEENDEESDESIHERPKSRPLFIFNDEFLPKVFSLRNTSSICYLNTMVQALMSCTSITESLSRLPDKDRDQLAICYLGLFKRNSLVFGDDDGVMKRGVAKGGSVKDGKINVDDASALIAILNLLCAERADKNRIIFSGQEDMDEGTVIFVNHFKNRINKLFYVYYSCELYCQHCKYQRNTPYDVEPWHHIDMAEIDPILQDQLTDKENIQKYIQTSVQIPRDYVCDMCHQKNEYNKTKKLVRPVTVQIYRLIRLSEIIILLFKNYDKNKRYFPPQLEFTTKSKKKTIYKVVAQVEHSGTPGRTSSGHYTCKCLRLKPPRMHKNRRAKIREAMQKKPHEVERFEHKLKKDGEIKRKVWRFLVK